MFRIQGAPQRDNTEERRRTRESVISNFIVFGAMVALIRASMYFSLK